MSSGSPNLSERQAVDVGAGASGRRLKAISDWLDLITKLVSRVILSLLLVGAIALVLNAVSATGLVVEPLKTPPEFATRNLDGTVLSQHMLDKLREMIDRSQSLSFRELDDGITGDWGNRSKVQIPQTDVSISELLDTLHQWLGRETRVTGEIYQTPKGYEIAVRTNPGRAVSIERDVKDLNELDVNALIAAAAEKVLAEAKPYRHAVYHLAIADVDDRKAIAAAMLSLRQLALTGDPKERLWARFLWGAALSMHGDNDEAAVVLDQAVHDAPNNPFGYYVRSGPWLYLGHDERVISDLRKSRELMNAPPSGVSKTALRAAIPNAEALIAHFRGDYTRALRFDREQEQHSWFGFNDAGPFLRASDHALRHDVELAARVVGELESRAPDGPREGAVDTLAIKASFVVGPELPKFFLLAELDKWEAAAADLEAVYAALQGSRSLADPRLTFVQPWLAYANAKRGAKDRALELTANLAAHTSKECTLCLRLRARIADLYHKGGELDPALGSPDDLFAQAAQSAPSQPFAYSEWGASLLRRGKLAEASEKFKLATEINPQFADAWVLWGKTLVAMDKPDEAIKHFGTARKYAENWSELYRAWSLALNALQRREEAEIMTACADELDRVAKAISGTLTEPELELPPRSPIANGACETAK